jgi:hypothetical protein
LKVLVLIILGGFVIFASSEIAKMQAHKAGRVEMYAEICTTLGVTDTHWVQVGNSTIRPDGIETIYTIPKPIRTDLCNVCHTGGIHGI